MHAWAPLLSSLARICRMGKVGLIRSLSKQSNSQVKNLIKKKSYSRKCQWSPTTPTILQLQEPLMDYYNLFLKVTLFNEVFLLMNNGLNQEDKYGENIRLKI